MGNSDWCYYDLGDLAKVQGGFAFKSKDFTSRGVPVVKIKNVRKRDIDLSEVDFVSESIADKCSNFFVRRGDVLISMTGSGPNAPASIVGRVARQSGPNNEFLINQRVGRFLNKDNNRLDLRYLYYFLSQKTVQELLVSIATGSANQVNISAAQIESIKVPLCPLQEQKSIAHILGTLDDKIELNCQMNASLEAMAQALFKSWFVDFDPVIDNALAAGNPIPEPLHARAEARKALGDKRKPLPKVIQQQFPSSFVFSEEMGWLPEGWESKKIKEFVEVTDYVANGSFASLKSNVKLYDVPEYALYIRTTDFKNGFKPDKAKYVDKHSYEFLKKSVLTGDEVIISNVGDTGTVFKPPRWLNMPMTLGSNAIALRSDNMSNFLHLYFSSYFGQHQISGIVGGSAQPKFNKTDFRALNVYFGSRELVTGFENISLVNRQKIESLSGQVGQLEKLRDTLLPKLLSGQLRIPDAEKQIAEAI